MTQDLDVSFYYLQASDLPVIIDGLKKQQYQREEIQSIIIRIVSSAYCSIIQMVKY